MNWKENESYWIDQEEGIELIHGLIGRRVVDVVVEKKKYGVIIELAFENGTKLHFDMTGYPEEWRLLVRRRG